MREGERQAEEKRGRGRWRECKSERWSEIKRENQRKGPLEDLLGPK